MNLDKLKEFSKKIKITNDFKFIDYLRSGTKNRGIYILIENDIKYIFKIVQYLTDINIIENTTNLLIEKNICIHFYYYIGFIDNHYLLKNQKAIIYEYIKPWKYNDINISSLFDIFANKIIYFNMKTDFYNDIIYNIIFQVLYSLRCLEEYRINHNDMNLGNILLEDDQNNKNTYDKYTIKNKSFYVPNYGFRVKVIDYGVSCGDNHKNSEIVGLEFCGIYGTYSKYYDIHKLLNGIYNAYIYLLNFLNLSKINKITEIIKKIIPIRYIGYHKYNKNLSEYDTLIYPFKYKDLLNPNDKFDEVKDILTIDESLDLFEDYIEPKLYKNNYCLTELL